MALASLLFDWVSFSALGIIGLIGLNITKTTTTTIQQLLTDHQTLLHKDNIYLVGNISSLAIALGVGILVT